MQVLMQDYPPIWEKCLKNAILIGVARSQQADKIICDGQSFHYMQLEMPALLVLVMRTRRVKWQ